MGVLVADGVAVAVGDGRAVADGVGEALGVRVGVAVGDFSGVAGATTADVSTGFADAVGVTTTFALSSLVVVANFSALVLSFSFVAS